MDAAREPSVRLFRIGNWDTKRSEPRLLGILGHHTLLCKNLLHSCWEGEFDKLINLSFLLPKHSCHSSHSSTPKLWLSHQKLSIPLRCLLFDESRARAEQQSGSLAARQKSERSSLPVSLPAILWNDRCSPNAPHAWVFFLCFFLSFLSVYDNEEFPKCCTQMRDSSCQV